MDAELKAKWTAALRSGEYKQGRYTLRNQDDEFCCLGVLGNICDASQWEKHNHWDGWYFGERDSLLPIDFAESLGLTESNQDTLSELNDGFDNGDRSVKEHSFSEIADYIEKNL